MNSKFKKFLEIIVNLIFVKEKIVFIVEDKDWSIRKDAENISKTLRLSQIPSRLRLTHLGLRNKIIHFCSISTLLNKKGMKNVHPSNKIILTWFHVEPDDLRLQFSKILSERIDHLITSCELTKEVLIQNGFNSSKITVIPIAIDLKNFTSKFLSKNEARAHFKLPIDKFIIGSFQKDGNGWNEGETPKLIKGPDVFCDTLLKIQNKKNIHILLSGPARGYVKKRLEEMKITYSHFYLQNANEVSDLFKSIDAYLMTSRVEGGPKSLLESWAIEVPFIGTKCGMVRDFAVHKHNALLAEIEDSDSLKNNINILMSDDTLKNQLILNGKREVEKFYIENLIEHYVLIYQKFGVINE